MIVGKYIALIVEKTKQNKRKEKTKKCLRFIEDKILASRKVEDKIVSSINRGQNLAFDFP